MGRVRRPHDINVPRPCGQRVRDGELDTGGIRVKSPQRFALAGLTALALLGAGCSSSGSGSSSGGTDWSTVSTASAGGGMAKLIAAAKKEGTLNVIALPPTWANYGNIIKDFTKKYGIAVVSQNPAGSSLFAPYKVSTWNAIPATQKDPGGLWTQDYGGYMSVGYNSAKFGTITSVSQLLTPKFKSAVALNGNPTQANAALNGVMMVNLAAGGTASSIAKGVNFFHQLKQAGNFVPVQATSATIKAGTTPVVINWDYLNTASVVGQGPTWKVFDPPN